MIAQMSENNHHRRARVDQQDPIDPITIAARRRHIEQILAESVYTVTRREIAGNLCWCIVRKNVS